MTIDFLHLEHRPITKQKVQKSWFQCAICKKPYAYDFFARALLQGISEDVMICCHCNSAINMITKGDTRKFVVSSRTTIRESNLKKSWRKTRKEILLSIGTVLEHFRKVELQC